MSAKVRHLQWMFYILAIYEPNITSEDGPLGGRFQTSAVLFRLNFIFDLFVLREL